MRITVDPAKRDATLAERKLDFADAQAVSAGRRCEVPDLRFPYPEPRHIAYGFPRERMLVVVWTPTAEGRRIISMRKADERERKAFGQRLGVHRRL